MTPELITTAIECSPLPTITNGMISYSPDVTSDYDLGTEATYTCEAGFYLEGNEVRVCMDDDGIDTIVVWSGQEPSCVRKLSVKVCRYCTTRTCMFGHMQLIITAIICPHLLVPTHTSISYLPRTSSFSPMEHKQLQ